MARHSIEACSQSERRFAGAPRARQASPLAHNCRLNNGLCAIHHSGGERPPELKAPPFLGFARAGRCGLHPIQTSPRLGPCGPRLPRFAGRIAPASLELASLTAFGALRIR